MDVDERVRGKAEYRNRLACGRRFLVKLLEQLSDAQLADLFSGARFDKPRNALKGTTSIPEWVRVFKSRVRTISDGPPCPDA